MTRIIFALVQQFVLVTNHRTHYRTNGPLIPGNYITILELVGSTEGIRSCFSALLMFGKHRPFWSHDICPCSVHPANLFFWIHQSIDEHLNPFRIQFSNRIILSFCRMLFCIDTACLIIVHHIFTMVTNVIDLHHVFVMVANLFCTRDSRWCLT